jgi:hypothetical protein
MNKAKITNLLTERLGITVWNIENEGEQYRVYLTVEEELMDMIVAELQQYTDAYFEFNTELIVFK